MPTRREFLSAGAAMSVLSLAPSPAHATSSSTYPVNELEARIARKDFRDMTKDMLPTPCMVVDLDMFNANVKHMADTAKASGINVRPHVKVHKSVDVAKHQVAAGAVGLTCATIAEAELFSGAGIKGILWTKQPVGFNNIQRAVALSKKDPSFMLVDRRRTGSGLAGGSGGRSQNKAANRSVAVYAGMNRQGIEGGKPALELAQKICILQTHAIRRLHGLLRRCRPHQRLRSQKDEVHGRARGRARKQRPGAQIRLAGKHHVRRLHRHLQHRLRHGVNGTGSRHLCLHGH